MRSKDGRQLLPKNVGRAHKESQIPKVLAGKYIPIGTRIKFIPTGEDGLVSLVEWKRLKHLKDWYITQYAIYYDKREFTETLWSPANLIESITQDGNYES